MQARSILVVYVLLAGCNHLFPYEPIDVDASVPDVKGPDVTVDLDQASEEAAPDLPDLPQPEFACEEPDRVLDGFENDKSVPLAEVAISTDGKKLYAIYPAGGVAYVADRPQLADGFGPWKIDSSFPAGLRDPSFFAHGGIQYLMGAAGSPRTLKMYQLDPDSWKEVGNVSVVGQSGDVDGPKVYPLVTTADDPPMLLLNRTDGSDIDIVVASPTGVSGSWTWTTPEEIASLSYDNEREDDPTIDPFGEVLVFARMREDNRGELYYVLRTDTEDPTKYSEPLPLDTLNAPDGYQYAPELWREKDSLEFELFFSAKSGPLEYQVYRSRCTLQP